MEIGDKFLPVGSVVLLKGGSKRVMIIGFCPVTSEKKSYDYTACLYPEGVINPNESLLFNHEDIERVFALGYKDNDFDVFMEKLKNILATQNNNSSENNVAPVPDIIQPTAIAKSTQQPTDTLSEETIENL